MQIRNIKKNLWPVRESDDVKPFDYNPLKDKSVYGVYHVFCVNAWKKLVTEQLDAIKESGLMDVTDKFFISCIVRDKNDKSELELLLAQYPITFEFISVLPITDNQFEFPALEFIRELAIQHDFYVYYFHTKGVSYTEERMGNYPSSKLEKLNRCSKAWRKMMEYFVFTKYKVALNVLKKYDTYGCKYDDPIVPPFHYKYYAGNFWWSKASYIKTLPPFSEQEKKNRYWAENWLLQKAHNIFSAFNTSAELYAVEIPKCVYMSAFFIEDDLLPYVKFLAEHYLFIIRKLIK